MRTPQAGGWVTGEVLWCGRRMVWGPQGWRVRGEQDARMRTPQVGRRGIGPSSGRLGGAARWQTKTAGWRREG